MRSAGRAKHESSTINSTACSAMAVQCAAAAQQARQHGHSTDIAPFALSVSSGQGRGAAYGSETGRRGVSWIQQRLRNKHRGSHQQ